ncbi:MAG: dTDP-4-dehydrorhamnose reductase [Paludibacteraceae bacterium]|nr:dTDP-4-dehydrorhamnose reductase [Paludibacteraceae bacterium]
MRVLVTGCKGQLGTEMRRLSVEHTKHSYVYVDIDELDLTDGEAVKRLVEKEKTDVIVNCAAYTNVDGAEENEAAALRVNADAVENLARTGRKIIHISTDYIFSGEGWLPYRETDAAAPRTAYGRTKWEGEKRLKEWSRDAIVFRTAWLYSPWGKNFVKTMLKYGAEKDELRVVYDQIGSPTYAGDLARVIYAALDADEWHGGTYHVTDEGVCSWYDFTVEILRQANERENKYKARVIPIRSDEYVYKTPRPHYSVLDKQKVKDTFGVSIPHWTESLKECLEQMI